MTMVVRSVGVRQAGVQLHRSYFVVRYNLTIAGRVGTMLVPVINGIKKRRHSSRCKNARPVEHEIGFDLT